MPFLKHSSQKNSKLSSSGIITLLTDFGNSDGYVAAMKGIMLEIYPQVHFVDISHEIGSYDIASAHFLLYAHYKYFPKGTVHLAVVDPGVGTARQPVACVYDGHYFIAPDNGLLDFCLNEKSNAVKLTQEDFWHSNISTTFHGRDIFAPTAAYLASGMAFTELGCPIQLKT